MAFLHSLIVESLDELKSSLHSLRMLNCKDFQSKVRVYNELQMKIIDLCVQWNIKWIRFWLFQSTENVSNYLSAYRMEEDHNVQSFLVVHKVFLHKGPVE